MVSNRHFRGFLINSRGSNPTITRSSVPADGGGKAIFRDVWGLGEGYWVSKRERAAGKLVPAKRSSLGLQSTLLADVRSLIDQTRDVSARAVNSALVLLYWSIGDRIRRDILLEKRAEYGEQIMPTLSAQLVAEYGLGYAEKNLRRMVQFSEVFPNRDIVVTLSRQLGWSHFIALIPIKDPLKRDFYAEMSRVERWSVRTLRQKDLEAAIIREIESFLLELGAGFTFVARQKRIIIDGEDFYLDLLFYHRKLRRLVALDLKLGKFAAADKGQMELYLRWLDVNEREPGEDSPLGLILCESAGSEQVELLQLSESGIRLATYLTELPPKAVLQRKLHAAAQLARERLKAAE